VLNAAYDSELGTPACLKGTRVALLATLANWVQDETAQRIFWLSGLSGTGTFIHTQT
jgi:hypothetical protein